MSEQKKTLREFHDYVAVTYEANHKIAARIWRDNQDVR